MPRLIIKLSQHRVQVMELEEGIYSIGRGDGCTIRLPNVSVSRMHARLVLTMEECRVIDLDSQNGVFVNAERLKNVALKSRDEIGIGRFSLIFLGDDPEDRFYQGRAVSYMPSYDEALVIHGDTTGTFALNAADLKRVQHNLLKVEKASIALESDPSRRWVPGEKVLTFGPGGKVSFPGMGSFGGVVAEVYWNGRSHVLVSKARLTATKVNGKKVDTRDLQNGDHIRIGKVGLKYQAPKQN